MSRSRPVWSGDPEAVSRLGVQAEGRGSRTRAPLMFRAGPSLPASAPRRFARSYRPIHQWCCRDGLRRQFLKNLHLLKSGAKEAQLNAEIWPAKIGPPGLTRVTYHIILFNCGADRLPRLIFDMAVEGKS